MKECEITVSFFDNIRDVYHQCGKPAKYITPKDFSGKKRYACGRHRRSIDKMYERLHSEDRCKLINNSD